MARGEAGGIRALEGWRPQGGGPRALGPDATSPREASPGWGKGTLSGASVSACVCLWGTPCARSTEHLKPALARPGEPLPH